MSVTEDGVVDAIGVENATDTVVLTITDHLEWTSVSAHLEVLRAKLNRYLAFVESGELNSAYPVAQGRPVRVDVVFKFSPAAEALEFLTNVAATVQGAGLTFSWRVLADTTEGVI